jgi:hypothetical protein
MLFTDRRIIVLPDLLSSLLLARASSGEPGPGSRSEHEARTRTYRTGVHMHVAHRASVRAVVHGFVVVHLLSLFFFLEVISLCFHPIETPA